MNSAWKSADSVGFMFSLGWLQSWGWGWVALEVIEETLLLFSVISSPVAGSVIEAGGRVSSTSYSRTSCFSTGLVARLGLENVSLNSPFKGENRELFLCSCSLIAFSVLIEENPVWLENPRVGSVDVWLNTNCPSDLFADSGAEVLAKFFSWWKASTFGEAVLNATAVSEDTIFCYWSNHLAAICNWWETIIYLIKGWAIPPTNQLADSGSMRCNGLHWSTNWTQIIN